MAHYPHDRLREARERAGYGTAAAFADAHELTESTYRSHENGARGMTVAAARRYGELLGVSWSWILEGEGEAGNAAPPPSAGEPPEAGAAKSKASPRSQAARAPARRPRLDIEVLAAIIERIDANLRRRRRRMGPLQRAELIANAYALVEDLGLEGATRELRAGLRVRSRAAAKSA